jgi:hypothetical protein
MRKRNHEDSLVAYASGNEYHADIIKKACDAASMGNVIVNINRNETPSPKWHDYVGEARKFVVVHDALSSYGRPLHCHSTHTPRRITGANDGNQKRSRSN